MARLIQTRENGDFIFVHIAKTGGTFFREAVNMVGIPNKEVSPKHSSIKETMDVYEEKQAVAIAFVRHPVEWYASRWRYGMMTHFGEKIKYQESAKKHWMAPVWSENLNVFVENTLEMYPQGIASKYFYDMTNTVEIKADVLMKVFQYETLAVNTFNIIKHVFGYHITGPEILKMPKFLDSSGVSKQWISTGMAEEIVKVEAVLMNKWYGNGIQDGKI